MREARANVERSQREEDLSLQRAQDKARDILNLSTSDLEDIMSADGDRDSQVLLCEIQFLPDPPENCHLTVKKLPKT